MHVRYGFPQTVLKLVKTALSITDKSRSYGELGSVDKASINRLDYHNTMAEWIGTPKNIHQKPGAPFGKPVYVSKAVYWRDEKFHPEWQADTQPKRKSLDPTKAGTPPNPGRPELGGVLRDAK